MKVELIAHSPNPEMVVAQSAKLCYSPVGVEEIAQGMTQEQAENFVEMLTGLSHVSPIEHVSFTFAVEGVSRVLTHQLVRHRLASYSQQSQRYVRLDQFEYIVPPAIDEIPEAREKFIAAMEADQRAYDELVELLLKKHEEKYLAQGLTAKQAHAKAEKESIEDARYVFPNACETKIVVTMNARNLLHFFNLRLCLRAQWEIRQLALEMLKAVLPVAPSLFSKAGPPCVRGGCPEGKMTCGKIQEVREFYGGLHEK
ncbi:MAG: FAD-dependent thymidylate synthase [Tissierellia bacterium]|nr:FAD-dependent thymidylate synthase [Tissierellia bacterium]